MSRILIITSILPIDHLSHKKNENDILFVTEDKIKEVDPSFQFRYLYVQTYSNKWLGKLSKRWAEFASFCQKEKFKIFDRELVIFPLIQLPKKTFIKKWLYDLSLAKYHRRIDDLVKEFKPDLIHAQNSDSNAYLAQYIEKKYNIPFILSLREINMGVDKVIQDNIKNAKSLIAISPIQQRDLAQFSPRQSTLIPHGIEEKFFIDNHYLINEKQIKVVLISRLLKYKNIHRVINAYQHLPYFTLDIIGEGKEMGNLKQQISELNLESRVRLLGRKSHDEILSVLPYYNLFILISYPETLGRVYFEVMASGIPIIASKDTGIDGIATHGHEGFFVNAENYDELIQVLSIIAKKPEILISMGQNAKNLAYQYRWECIVSQYFNVYNKVMSK